MAWEIDFSKDSAKQIDKLDHQSRKLVRDYLRNRVAKLDHPRLAGKALEGNMSGFWRYRVDKFRIVCRIKDMELLVLVVEIGSRDKVYKMADIKKWLL